MTKATLTEGLACMVLVLALGTFISAQEAKPEPVLDSATKELVTAWLREDQANQKTVLARGEAMVATPQGQAYQAATKERDGARARINKQLSTKVPGFELDFATGKVVPVKPPAPK